MSALLMTSASCVAVILLSMCLVQTDARRCIYKCKNKRDGNYQWCGLCTAFLTCSNRNTHVMLCPGTTVWDNKAKRCEHTSSTCSQNDPALFDPCLAKPCDHGSCVQQDLSYFCSCDEGFTGPDCSVKTTKRCPSLPYTQAVAAKTFRAPYFPSHQPCVNLLPFSLSSCSGRCGNDMKECVAKKYKSKKATLVCDDGFRAVAEFEEITKCGCVRNPLLGLACSLRQKTVFAKTVNLTYSSNSCWNEEYTLPYCIGSCSTGSKCSFDGGPTVINVPIVCADGTSWTYPILGPQACVCT